MGHGVIVVRSSGQSYNPAGIEIYAGSAMFQFDNGGNLSMSGTLSAGVKNFVINHPLAPSTKQLVHSSLEGPEAAVYYRGEAQLSGGVASIKLPDYFEALTRPEQRTVQLTPIDGWSPLYVSGGVIQGALSVRTNVGGDPAQRFYWEVKAVRADVPNLAVEKVKPQGLVNLPTTALPRP